MIEQRYNRVAIVLHWAIAGLVLLNIVLGFTFANSVAAETHISAIAQVHKSIGLTVLLLSLFRLAWRLTHPAPPITGPFAGLARAVHGLFYVLLIATPLAGWALVSVSPRNIATRYFFLFTWPHIGLLHGMDLSVRRRDISRFVDVHNGLALLSLGLIGLHLAAALYHHRRGVPVIRRILP